MRQGQHKNRSRNRGRRPNNSLTRVYESNGPDVKVRGTAQTVADKYLQLARDAQSSGDIVKAESYYQHAEHYLRILAVTQPVGLPGQQQRRAMYDDDAYEDGEEGSGDSEAGGDEAPASRGSAAGRSDAEAEQDEAVEFDSRPRPQSLPQPEPRPQALQQSQPVRESGIEEGGNGWDGHQPDFLRRSGQPNGSPPGNPRPRRERRPRPRPAQPELAGSEQPQIPTTASDDGDKTGGNG